MAGLSSHDDDAQPASEQRAGIDEQPRPARRRLGLVHAAVAVSLAMLGLRLDVASFAGFGDAEALYVSYALHPQPAYVDHPGLIGAMARAIGRGSAPSPGLAHIVTATLATLVPWIGALAARAAGASWRGAMRTVLVLALVPEIGIGLFGLTPHLPLALAWLGALAFGALALRSPASSFRALIATLGAGGLAGVACLSHATGVLLALALLSALFGRGMLARWKTAAPWAAIGIALVLVLPLLVWEARSDFPMLRHRLIATQGNAGFSLRNLGALVGGQLAYVTPPFLAAAAFVLTDLARERARDPATRLLWLATLVPAAVLVPLCLWSRVAEPHWLAPAYLALAVHVARRDLVGRKLAVGSLVTGAVITLLAWLWVRTPLPVVALGASYRARYDLANDLYAWGPAGRLLEDAVTRALSETRRLPVVVGPHWTVCAQAHARLEYRVPVGCNTAIRDDFDRWLPRKRWLDAPVVLYVHDSRFQVRPELELPGRAVTSSSQVEIVRGGRVVRTIWVTRLEKLVEIGEHRAEMRYAGRVNKRYKLSTSQIQSIARGFGGCIASDRITVDGFSVGFMYREAPDNDLDSGWRFLAGDEDDDYLNDAANLAVYDVNTIANYDRTIVEYLDAPMNSAFCRNREGTFTSEPYEPPEEE
jgi:hypothetical protein